MTCTNQNKTFAKSPNEMSSTQAYRGDLVVQANSINWVSNKNNIIKNNINKDNINKNNINNNNINKNTVNLSFLSALALALR
jgi:hypothetical protein